MPQSPYVKENTNEGVVDTGSRNSIAMSMVDWPYLAFVWGSRTHFKRRIRLCGAFLTRPLVNKGLGLSTAR